MHRDPKHEAQIAEEAGLTAEPDAAPSVANPDAPGEEGLEAAIARTKELERTKPDASRPKDRAATPLDRLDRERAAGEGMIPPS